jgi:hypothetical protein
MKNMKTTYRSFDIAEPVLPRTPSFQCSTTKIIACFAIAILAGAAGLGAYFAFRS